MNRNLVYETWCETCYREEVERIDEEEGTDSEKLEKRKKIKVHKYIGETARSVFERGLEHLSGLEKLDEDNHLVKHMALYHKDQEMEEIKFGIRVVKYAYSAMERQIMESVKIQEERKEHLLMNSKAEYNRCTIPRLTAKMGEKEYNKKREEEKKKEK